MTLLGSATVTVCYARRTAPGWRFSGDEHDETPQADDNCSFTRTAHELRASSSELDLHAGDSGRRVFSVEPDSSKRSNRMRIVVDLNKCLGYAQCAFLAPTVFELHGAEALMSHPNPGAATRLNVLRAAAPRAVHAILGGQLGH